MLWQGPREDFHFEVPEQLLPPPKPTFRILPSKLHMRLLIRMGLSEAQRVRMGWFRSAEEVNKTVDEGDWLRGSQSQDLKL